MVDQWIAKIKSGNLSDREINRAYRSNLEYVFGEVQRLLGALECPTVITADHGEHLGENGRYLHEESSKYTRTVPWLRVKSTTGNEDASDLDDISRNEDRPSMDAETIDQRLKDLGYTE